MLKNILYDTLNRLNNFNKDNSKLYECVSFKLDRTLKQYYESISKVCNYILSRNNSKVIKDITKREIK